MSEIEDIEVEGRFGRKEVQIQRFGMEPADIYETIMLDHESPEAPELFRYEGRYLSTNLCMKIAKAIFEGRRDYERIGKKKKEKEIQKAIGLEPHKL